MSEARTDFAGAALQVARRYAAGIPATARNEVDEAVWETLDRLPGAKRRAALLARRADRLTADRRKALFGTFAATTAAKAIPLRDLGSIIERLGDVRAPGGQTPARHRYELAFSHLICDDISNPEFAGKDEPYTVFTVITQAQADSGEPARSVLTPVFKVKEGDRAPATGSADVRLFGPSGPAFIDSDVLVTAAHFEHDAGDLAEIAADLAVILTVVAGLAKSAKKDLASTILGALAALSGIVATIAADDPVGNPTAVLVTEADAEARTAAQAQVVLPALRFDGGDPNGVYRDFLTLRRS